MTTIGNYISGTALPDFIVSDTSHLEFICESLCVDFPGVDLTHKGLALPFNRDDCQPRFLVTVILLGVFAELSRQ